MNLLFLKYLHVIGAIILVGSIITLDVMTLKLVLAKKNPGLKIFYIESKFIERFIIGPGALLTTITGIIMAWLWYGWPFWLNWGLFVVAFTGFTGSVTIPKVKKKLADLISSESSDQLKIKKLTGKFIFFITVDVILLVSAVWTMVYKPVW